MACNIMLLSERFYIFQQLVVCIKSLRNCIESISVMPSRFGAEHLFPFFSLASQFITSQVGEVMTLCKKQSKQHGQMTEMYCLYIADSHRAAKLDSQPTCTNFVKLTHFIKFRENLGLSCMRTFEPGPHTSRHRTGFVCTAHLLISCDCMLKGRRLDLTGFPACLRV